MITKSEYIALREMTAAYCAILYSLNKAAFKHEVVNTREIRGLLQTDTGYPFSELAVAKALNAPKPYSFATQVSGSTETGAYRIDPIASKSNYLSLASSERSPVWQLENIDHSSFRSMVANVRTDAAKNYETHRNYDDPYPAPWSDINLQLMDGMFRQRVGKGAKPNFSNAFKGRLGLQEWSAIATLVGLPLAVLLWWFS